MKHFFLAFFLVPLFSFSQLLFDRRIDLGTISTAYEIKGDIIIKNDGAKKVFLMRADADPGVKVYTSKKTLLPGDTCLLIISFLPEKNGVFNKEIDLVSSESNDPHKLLLTGNLKQLERNDKQACFYFGRRRSSGIDIKEDPIFIPDSDQKRDVTNRIPDKPSEPIVTPTTQSAAPAISAPPKSPQPNTKSTLLEEKKYLPNNIVFLVDISGSMKDSLKLPLMKEALHHLVNAIRENDKITFITYADTIKVLAEARNGADRESLHRTISALKAKGMTKGKKALFQSLDLLQKNYIAEGNNEINIATDGEFKFEKDDHKIWKTRQGTKPAILTTMAFGTEKEALKNLKELSKKGNGSFIHVTTKQEAKDKLLDEIKKQSLVSEKAK